MAHNKHKEIFNVIEYLASNVDSFETKLIFLFDNTVSFYLGSDSQKIHQGNYTSIDITVVMLNFAIIDFLKVHTKHFDDASLIRKISNFPSDAITEIEDLPKYRLNQYMYIVEVMKDLKGIVDHIKLMAPFHLIKDNLQSCASFSLDVLKYFYSIIQNNHERYQTKSYYSQLTVSALYAYLRTHQKHLVAGDLSTFISDQRGPLPSSEDYSSFITKVTTYLKSDILDMYDETYVNKGIFESDIDSSEQKESKSKKLNDNNESNSDSPRCFSAKDFQRPNMFIQLLMWFACWIQVQLFSLIDYFFSMDMPFDLPDFSNLSFGCKT